MAVVALCAAVGPALLSGADLSSLRVLVGGLLLLFGLEWLRKGVLRMAGLRRRSSSYDEYLEERDALATDPTVADRDWAARLVAFKGVFLEGLEVGLIVLALGGSGAGRMVPAVLGAAAALVIVIAIGVVLHAPLRRLPETQLKLGVGIALTALRHVLHGRGPRCRVAARRRGAPVPRGRLRRGRLARCGAPPNRPAARAGGRPVIDLLRSLRSLILGETWTIPLGVATTLLVAALLRAALSDHLWDEMGGFARGHGCGHAGPSAREQSLSSITLVTSISLSSRR